jgi:phage-related protein
MDIAAATGKPLSAVTDALAKAYGGNTKALAKLDPKLKGLIKDGLDAEGAMSVLADTFGGAASTKANTAAGQFQRLQVSLAETKESIGAALLPAVNAVLPYLTKFGNWASNNTGLFLTIAGVIGGIAAAVLIVNGAIAAWTAITTAATAVQAAFNAVLALNPITLIVIGIGLLIAALAAAYFKFEGFRNIVDSVFKFIGKAVSGSIDLIKSYFTGVLGFYKAMFNGIASLWNNTFGKLSFKIPSFVPGIGGKGFDVPNIPMLAQGGIVTSPTLAMIGEGAGPEAVIPLDRMGEFGMGGGGGVTINVQGGDPQAVVDALTRWYRQNGPLPVKVA